MKPIKFLTKSFAIMMVLSLVFVACKKNFLDIQPQDGSLTTQSFWKNKKDFDAAIIATYRAMNNTNAGGDNWITTPNAILNEMLPNAGFIDLQNEFQTSSRIGWWSSFYLMVHRANQPITNISKGAMTDAERKSVLAEAKFLRGFAYFNLVRGFGGVPLILAPKSASDSREDVRATEQASWEQVIADFKDAADGLPSSWDAANVGRATKGAALAYLANAYMYLKDWTKAAESFTALQALNVYDLMATPREVFSEKNENNKESVFEIQFTQGYENGWSTDGTGGGGASNVHFLGLQSAPGGIGAEFAAGGGWGGSILSTQLAASFATGDRRRFSFSQGGVTIYPWVLGATESYKGEVMATAYTLPTGTVSTNACCTKYWLGPNSPTIPGGSDLGCGQNLIQMRYAEVLLNLAEVTAEQGNLAGAYTQLNKVRTRAGLPVKPVADKATFETDLLNERRHELFWEPNLYFHLSRKKQLVNYLRNNYNKVFQDFWYYWPIPQSELDQNKALVQNPGYN